MAKPRSVAVCILIHTSDLSSSPHFLIVTSRRHENRWILPKGGVELNESSIEAAEREAWEEGELWLVLRAWVDHERGRTPSRNLMIRREKHD